MQRGGDMLEFYLQSARGIARARSSLVGPYLDGFAAALRELGYCRLVGQWCITYAVHLGLWAAAEGVPLGAFEAGAVRAAVHEVTGGHGTATARYVAKVARGFLRYLAVAGRCRPGLDAAILPVANWRRASLPRYVSADAVQRIIDACDATRPEGARDRAILLLLARLGLRAGDIVGLELRDL